MITDEIVLKLTRALAVYRANNPYGNLQDEARAALTAVLPDIVEACAKEIEKAVVRSKSGDSAYDLAMAIRALATDRNQKERLP